MNIYLLVGLPGAGKTTWLKNKDGIIFDDMSQIENGIKKLEKVLNENNENNIYIADVNFCDIEILRKAQKNIQALANNNANFILVMFDANEETALINVQYRNDGRYVIPTIKRFNKKLINTIEIVIDEEKKENIILVKSINTNHINENKLIQKTKIK